MYMIITDPKQSATTKKSILGELTKFTDAGATNGKIFNLYLGFYESCELFAEHN